MNHEQQTIDVVKKVLPAVVSIVVGKDYEDLLRERPYELMVPHGDHIDPPPPEEEPPPAAEPNIPLAPAPPDAPPPSILLKNPPRYPPLALFNKKAVSVVTTAPLATLRDAA